MLLTDYNHKLLQHTRTHEHWVRALLYGAKGVVRVIGGCEVKCESEWVSDD